MVLQPSLRASFAERSGGGAWKRRQSAPEFAGYWRPWVLIRPRGSSLQNPALPSTSLPHELVIPQKYLQKSVYEIYRMWTAVVHSNLVALHPHKSVLQMESSRLHFHVFMSQLDHTSLKQTYTCYSCDLQRRKWEPWVSMWAAFREFHTFISFDSQFILLFFPFSVPSLSPPVIWSVDWCEAKSVVVSRFSLTHFSRALTGTR